MTDETVDDTPVLADVVAKVKANMAATYDLVYVAYDDKFTDEQIEVLLSGENPWENKEFDHTQEWEADQRHDQAMEAIKDMLTDEEWEVLEYSDEIDDLRLQIQDRDSSNWFNELLANSGSVLMRLDLDVDVPAIGNEDEADIEQHITDLLDELADDKRLAPQTAELVRSKLREPLSVILNEQAYYGGKLEIFFNGDVVTWYERLADVRNGKRVTATFTDFYLLCRDGLNGSGYDEKIEGFPFTLTLGDGDVVTDKNGGGYAWDDIAGLVHSAYDTDVTFDVTESEPAAS